MANYCYGYLYIYHHTCGLARVTCSLLTSLQQNTEAADAYGLKFGPLPVLISALSFPCRKHQAVCCTSSAPDLTTATQHATVPHPFYLCLSPTGCHTISTLVACHRWAKISFWRSTASQTTTGAGEGKMMTYITGSKTLLKKYFTQKWQYCLYLLTLSKPYLLIPNPNADWHTQFWRIFTITHVYSDHGLSRNKNIKAL